MIAAEAAKAEEAAEEEAGRAARQAACDAFEAELNAGKAQTAEPEGVSRASGEPSAPVHQPPKEEQSKKWDLEMVQDLLELVEAGEKIAWPSGLDTVEARRLLKSAAKRQRL